MGCFSPDAPERNMGKEFTQFVDAYQKAMPDIYNAESTYRPLFAGLDLREMEASLMGREGGTRTEYVDEWTGKYVTDNHGRSTGIKEMRRVPTEVSWPTSKGLFDIYDQAAPRVAALNTAQRSSEIADVQALGPAALRAFQAANPQQAQLMATLNQQAQSELELGASLDPSLQRQVQQSVRGAQAARGMGFGPADAYEETYTSGLQAEQLRRARQQFAQQMVGLNAQTSVDPFLAILGRSASASSPYMVNQSQGINGATGPSMFNPMNSYTQDFYNTNFNAASAAEIAGANNQTAMLGSAMGMFGSAAGGMCWVAREVYGESDPKWLRFREWLSTRAPAWFRKLYERHGERVAAFLKGKNWLKHPIRLWMDGRISSLNR